MGKIKESFEKLNIDISLEQEQQLEEYMDGVLQWNSKINLTAITDIDQFISKHYIDSALCVNLPEYKEAKKIIDVGTGAGFPGIPLAICSSKKSFTLLDSLKKRLKVIDSLSEQIGIGNVCTVHGRAEDFASNKEFREKYDVCVSRAVANLAVLAEYCLPFVRVGGFLLAYKGADAATEASQGLKAIKILGGQITRTEKIKIDNYVDDHNIIVIKKIKPTPAKFPRKAGIPSKEPII